MIIYIFYRINKIDDLNTIRKIYHAYANALFQYSLEVWGGTFDTHFDKTFVLQKHLIRAALGKPRLYPSKNCLRNLIHSTYVATNIHKNMFIYINNNKHLFQIRNTHYNTRPTIANLYDTAFSRLTICKHQVPYYCNRLSNKIPKHLINNKITRKLKFELQQWIKEKVYFTITNLSMEI
jgi:hypothetical protein